MQDSPTEPAAEAVPEDSGPKTLGLWVRLVSWSAWVALIGYAILLLLRARSQHQFTAHGPDVTLADLLKLRQWVAEAVLASVQMGLCFFLFGFLVALGLARPNGRGGALRSVGRWLAVALLGGGLFVLLSVVESGRLPSFVSLLLPAIGYLLGLWVGRTAIRGPRALLWLGPKMAALCLVFVAGLVTLGLLATDTAPLAIESPKVTSADKRRLVNTLRNPRPLDDGSRQLRFDQSDANLILTMGLAQVLPHGRGQLTLDEGTISGELSVPLVNSESSSRYLNVRGAVDIKMADGQLEVDLVHCRIGRLPVPQFVLDDVLHQGMTMMVNDRDLNTVLTAIGSLRVEPESIEAVLVSHGLVDNVLPSLMARLGQNPDVVAKTRIYYEHLAATPSVAMQEDRFSAILRSAFKLARHRSETSDPVLENRAAILALAIMLGHRRVEHLVGSVTDQELRLAARRHVGWVELRGRNDWCRHFLVSAALALLSSESMSEEAGLFKEELDAGEGGSGFSFSDLLADRAGTQFALTATRNETSARRMQERLADGFDLGEIFPKAADLPEGIPDPQLQAEYGGVGGEKYRATIAEIERRLEECEGSR